MAEMPRKAHGAWVARPFTKGFKHKRTTQKRILDMQNSPESQGWVISGWTGGDLKTVDIERFNRLFVGPEVAAKPVSIPRIMAPLIPKTIPSPISAGRAPQFGLSLSRGRKENFAPNFARVK